MNETHKKNGVRKTQKRKPASPLKNTGQTRNAHRKNIYKKSRYYRDRRKKMIAALCVAGAVLLLLVIIFGSRACSQARSSSAASDGQNTQTGTENGRESAVSEKGESKDDGSEAQDETGGGQSGETSSLPAEPVSLTVSVVGDCTLGTDENFDYDTSLNAYYESYGPDYFFSNVKSIFSADDLTIANFEGTLTYSEEREDKQFAFKAPPEFASILSAGDIEAVNTANNHSHDYGEQSFTDTMEALDNEGIVHFGYDETQVMDVKGVKVGLVGIYELNDHLERTEQLKQNIAKVKEEGAQLVIVIFHWGNEKEEVPDTNQMTLGRLAIDEGADLVCGHHPHVLQGIEEYKGKNIVYSLGNFCFGGNSYPSDMDSMIFQQTFTIDQDGVRADNVTNIIPCSISSDYSYNNYQPTPAEGEEADRIMQKIEERSSWIPLPESSSDTESSDISQ